MEIVYDRQNIGIITVHLEHNGAYALLGKIHDGCCYTNILFAAENKSIYIDYEPHNGGFLKNKVTDKELTRQILSGEIEDEYSEKLKSLFRGILLDNSVLERMKSSKNKTFEFKRKDLERIDFVEYFKTKIN